METNNNRRYHRRANYINFVKKFDSFEEGYKELSSIVTEVKAYGGEEAVYESVVCKLLDFVKSNIPTTNSSSYPNTISFSIFSREVGIKTDSNIAFGWKVEFDRVNAKQVFAFRVTFSNIPAYQKHLVDELKDAGWDNVEFAGRSRYWNRIERNGRYNNHRRYNSNRTLGDSAKEYDDTTMKEAFEATSVDNTPEDDVDVDVDDDAATDTPAPTEETKAEQK